jgi:sulfonate transport system substrate-binding protein
MTSSIIRGTRFSRVGLLSLFGAATLTVGAAGCSSGAGSKSSAADKPTLVIGQQQSGIVSLVRDSHALDGAPYNVKWAVFPFGPPLVAAAAAGQIDLGDVGDVPPLNGVAKSPGFKVVAAEVPANATQAGDYLIVPKDSPIKTLADLRGKKVGYPAGSSAHGFLLNAVQSVGLSSDTVTFVNLAPAALQSAFASGQLDAASFWNPQVTLDVQKGARILAAGTRPLDPNVGFYVASDKALKDPQRRALVADLLQRLGRAYQYGDTHQDVWAKDVQAETGVDADTAKIVVENGTVQVRYVSDDIVSSEQKLADTFLAAKQITGQVDVKGIVDNLLPTTFDGS